MIDTFSAFQTGFGPMSGLICGENSNPLAVFALTAEGTRVHVMNYDPAAAEATRRRILGELAGEPILMIGTHFAGPTAGHVVRDDRTFKLVV